MKAGRTIVRVLVWLGVLLLQLIMTQVVTFILSLLFPDLGEMGTRNPPLFALLLAITFAVGVFLAGWAALRWQWLKLAPRSLARLGAALVGAGIPLLIAVLVYRTLEPGNPFFFISVVVSIFAFYLPGWRTRQ